MKELFAIAEGMIARAEANMPRAVPYSAKRFDAFRVTESGATIQLNPIAATTVKEAIDAALVSGDQAIFHKEHVLIRETDERGVKLHLFAIKRRSQPTYVYRDYAYHREHHLYAAVVCVIDGGVLAGEVGE